MSFPTISSENAVDLVKLISANSTDWEISNYIIDDQTGECDMEAVDNKSAELQAIWVKKNDSTLKSRWRLEAKTAGPLHDLLKDVHPVVLSSKGFWRYLSLGPFLWYLRAREPELQAQDYGGWSVIGDPPRKKTHPFIYQLLYRTFLWGKIAYDPSDVETYRLATIVGENSGAEIDVWHSHLIRIQLGQLGEMPKAFLNAICEDPKTNDRDGARDVEKRLTRLKHSLLFEAYEYDDALNLVRNLK